MLQLNFSRLNSTIPKEPALVEEVRTLEMYSNPLSGLYLYGNDLSGPIPPELGGMVNLTRLSLSANSLSVTIS